MDGRALPLFEPAVPEGFFYRAAFITTEQEAALVSLFESVAFDEFEMRGVVAKRRVAFFGETYERGGAAEIPDFLHPLRAALAGWANVPPEAMAMALINKYPPGAPIGWHRDAPQYDIVAGLSLVTGCRMKFRPYHSPRAARSSTPPRRTTHEITLEPRSAYLITGPARTHYEHHIPPVTALRYSVTFRTLR